MDLRKLQKAAFASDYAHRQVAHLCNNIGLRLSGSPQAQKAVDYVAAEMKALGLDVRIERSYFESTTPQPTRLIRSIRTSCRKTPPL